MFGKVRDFNSLSESSEMVPNSPYALSKLTSLHLCRIYKEAYGLQISVSIAFNHESSLRTEEFVTKKVVKAALLMKEGRKQDSLKLGNIDAYRDWGLVKEYVQGFY